MARRDTTPAEAARYLAGRPLAGLLTPPPDGFAPVPAEIRTEDVLVLRMWERLSSLRWLGVPAETLRADAASLPAEEFYRRHRTTPELLEDAGVRIEPEADTPRIVEGKP